MRLHSIVVALALVIPGLASADDKQQNQPKAGDTQAQDKDKKEAKRLNEAEINIIAHVHHVNLMEIEMAKLAQRNGTPAVKKYAQQILTDHQTADTNLISFARQHGLPQIPAAKPQNDAEKAEQQQMTENIANLKKLKGADFDRLYLQMMVQGHEKELAMTDSMVATSMDPDLDMLLENRKSVLQRHLDAAKELQKGQPQAAK